MPPIALILRSALLFKYLPSVLTYVSTVYITCISHYDRRPAPRRPFDRWE